MKKPAGKNFGTITSVVAAVAVAILFWLIVKYIDSGALSAFDAFTKVYEVM